LVGLVAVTALVSCNSATAGQPKPTRTGSQATDEPTEESTSQTAESDYSLARLCELLSSDEAERLGGSAEGEKKNSASDGHEICGWANETYLVVGFQDGPTTADVRTGPGITNTPTTIDGLTAVQSHKTDTNEICQILVDLPSGKLFTSAVNVLSSGEGKYEPCAVAVELSNLIIPRVKDQ
jgi:hypothetical protein